MSKTLAYTVLLFGTIILIGGYFGYAKSGSIISLVTSLIFCIAFVLSGVSLLKNKVMGACSSFLISLIFFTLFLGRFLLLQKFFPAGALALLSLPVMILSLCVWITFKKKSSS